MKPGRELDALVSEKIFGWKWSEQEYVVTNDDRGLSKKQRLLIPPGEEIVIKEMYVKTTGFREVSIPIPNYSESIETAWKVVEKMTNIEKDSGFNPEFHLALAEANTDAMQWHAHFFDRHEKANNWGSKNKTFPLIAFSKSAPHAICLAALLAIGIEVND